MTNRFFKGGHELDPDALTAALSAMQPRDRALHLLRHTLLEQQLAAIAALIHRNQQADAATGIKFQDLDNDPRWTDPAAQEWLLTIRDEKFW